MVQPHEEHGLGGRVFSKRKAWCVLDSQDEPGKRGVIGP